MNVLLSITGRDLFECPLDSFCVDEIVMQHSTWQTAELGVCQTCSRFRFVTLLEKREIRAVHDRELPEFLERLGLAQQLNAGLLHCAICGSVVTQDTLGMVFPLRKEIKVCCSNVECLETAFRARKETWTAWSIGGW